MVFIQSQEYTDAFGKKSKNVLCLEGQTDYKLSLNEESGKYEVRIIIGDLDSIGRGKRSPEWLNDLLRGASRDSSDATAPPEGLYLWRVGYNKTFEWIE